MQSRRFERFDPVTVRAAARVIRVGWQGRVTANEVRCFLRHLIDLHPGQRSQSVGRLTRLARWRAAMGDRGLPSTFHMHRTPRPLSSRGGTPMRSGRECR